MRSSTGTFVFQNSLKLSSQPRIIFQSTNTMCIGESLPLRRAALSTAAVVKDPTRCASAQEQVGRVGDAAADCGFQLAQRAGFELAHALFRDAKLAPQCFERRARL